MKTFCVIPAYNEEKNIFTTISQVLPRVDFLVIVDDCSRDQTYEQSCRILNSENISSELKNKLKILRHPINLGQGASLQTGNEYALKNEADIIIHFDADGQFLAEEIEKVINPIKQGKADIVFGSRFLDIKSEIPSFKKNIIMPLAKLFNLIFFGIKTSDPQSGFRAMTKEVTQKIKIENNRMAHCTEILAKAHKYKFRIAEVPITVVYKKFGQKFSGGFKIIKDLFFRKISG
ncbi:MAG: glycosyltransferase family 2 protein [Patescibacteria group bacterium]|nr:glycosyltransferase family 2 protein [Patescibacteria group bacterium]